MNREQRDRLLDEMDDAAYKCVGVLAGILELHDRGEAPITDRTAALMRKAVAEFMALKAVYHAEDAIDKAQA